MIFRGSRYEFDRVFRAPLASRSESVVPVVLHLQQTSPSPVALVPYVWEAGDRIDRLAEREYGNPLLWWRIAEANPTVDDWERVAVGTVLSVPRG